ncbi:hypothetical protein ABIB40_003413 [Pedobacter sp. UYP30]|uniref:hypothetical protein n=1 Tax=Pedobacter sp. UYP30 TaxID=1756400 RepID=UPI003394F52E
MNNYLAIINQVFEIEQRLIQENNSEKFSRNFQKISMLLAEDGYKVSNPIGEAFSEARTDIDASLIGTSSKKKIIRVIKPIIYLQQDGGVSLIQKGIVIAE